MNSIGIRGGAQTVLRTGFISTLQRRRTERVHPAFVHQSPLAAGLLHGGAFSSAQTNSMGMPVDPEKSKEALRRSLSFCSQRAGVD